jgi:hypothetical protein
VNDTSHYTAGAGPLTYRGVLRQALGMFRIGYGRVALVALILFVPPPLLIAVLTGFLDQVEHDPGLIAGLGFVIVLIFTLSIRLFGPVVYAGYLEAAVGHEYYEGHRIRLGDVLRQLPWVRLIIADLILVTGTVAGLSLFVVPGLIWLTLFALVGPVIVQEDLGVIAAFRRTYRLSRKGWKMIFILVVVALGAEHAFEEIVHELLHDSGIGVQVVSEWAIAAVIGGVVGLIEVALATEFIARNPHKERPG